MTGRDELEYVYQYIRIYAMLVKCDHCKGMKTVMGLGNMYSDCMYCDGVGHVKVDSNKPSSDDQPIPEAAISKALKAQVKPKLVQQHNS
jgi:hypothetical protein